VALGDTTARGGGTADSVGHELVDRERRGGVCVGGGRSKVVSASTNSNGRAASAIVGSIDGSTSANRRRHQGEAQSRGESILRDSSGLGLGSFPDLLPAFTPKRSNF
jgi:hypothetical protein